MVAFGDWVRRIGGSLWHFIVEPWALWASVFLLATMLSWPWFFSGEQVFRCAAAALQIVGVGIIAVGMRSTRLLFGRPRMGERIASHWKARPLIWVTPRSANAPGAIIVAGVGFSPGRATAEAFSTLEARVEALERRVHDNDEASRSRDAKLAADLKEAKRVLAAAAEQARAEASAVRDLLGRFATGGLDLTFFSVFYLLGGIIYGLFPNELAR